MPIPGYVGNVALVRGGAEVLQVRMAIRDPDDDCWSCELSGAASAALKQVGREPDPITVTLLEGARRSQIAEAMVALSRRRVLIVGSTPFLRFYEFSERATVGAASARGFELYQCTMEGGDLVWHWHHGVEPAAEFSSRQLALRWMREWLDQAKRGSSSSGEREALASMEDRLRRIAVFAG